MEITFIEGVMRFAEKTRRTIASLKTDRQIVHFSAYHRDLATAKGYYEEFHGHKNIKVLHLESAMRRKCENYEIRNEILGKLREKDHLCPTQVACKMSGCDIHSCPIREKYDYELYDVIVAPYEYADFFGSVNSPVKTRDRYVVIDEIDVLGDRAYSNLILPLTIGSFFVDENHKVQTRKSDISIEKIKRNIEFEQEILDLQLEELDQFVGLLRDGEYKKISEITRDYEEEIKVIRDNYSDFYLETHRGSQVAHILECLSYLNSGPQHSPELIHHFPQLGGYHRHELLFPMYDQEGKIPVYEHFPRKAKKLWLISGTANSENLERLFRFKIDHHYDYTPETDDWMKFVHSISLDNKVNSKTPFLDVKYLIIITLFYILLETDASIMITFPNKDRAKVFYEDEEIQSFCKREERQMLYAGDDHDNKEFQKKSLIIVNYARSTIERGIQIEAPIHIVAGTPIPSIHSLHYKIKEMRKMGLSLSTEDFIMPSVVQSSFRVVEKERGALIIYLTDVAHRCALKLGYPDFFINLINNTGVSKFVGRSGSGGAIIDHEEDGKPIFDNKSMFELQEHIRFWASNRPISPSPENFKKLIETVLFRFGDKNTTETTQGNVTVCEMKLRELKNMLQCADIRSPETNLIEVIKTTESLIPTRQGTIRFNYFHNSKNHPNSPLLTNDIVKRMKRSKRR